MGQTPNEMLSAVSASLATRTGQSLDEWVASVHGVPQNSQYSGPKAALRPIYAAVAAAMGDLGDDVTIEGLQSASAPGQATHKVSLRGVQDVDDELLGLIRIAYEQNA